LIDSHEARSILAEAMNDPDPVLRSETVAVVENHSIFAKHYVPLLLENLCRDPAPSVRRAILRALVALEPDSERVVKARLHAMSDKNPETRVEAIRMSSRIGLKHSDVVAVLCQALSDPATRDEARIAIGHLDSIWRLNQGASLDDVLESAVPALIASARLADPRTRGTITALLCRLICQFARENVPPPPSLRAAVPQLLEIVNDGEPLVRLYALLAILGEPPNELLLPILRHGPGKHGEPSGDWASPRKSEWPAAIAAVEAILQASDPATKTHFLISFLPENLIESLLPALATATKDEDRDVRLGSMTLLFEIADEQAASADNSKYLARSTFPTITASLNSPFPDIREYAAVILGNLGPRAEKAVPALRDLVAKEQDPTVRARAQESLSSIAILPKPEDAR
jgi:HEAT repeat protein